MPEDQLKDLSRTVELAGGKRVVIRRASAADSDAIFALYDSIYHGTYTLDIVNKADQRLAALRDPNHYWLVIDEGQQQLIGSAIFDVDPPQRNGKVFAAVVREEQALRFVLHFVLLLHIGKDPDRRLAGRKVRASRAEQT